MRSPQKKLGLFGAAVATLGSMLSPGCFNGKYVNEENVRYGYGLTGIGIFFLCVAPIQEKQGGKELAYLIGGLSLAGGVTLLGTELYCSSLGYNESDEEINLRLARQRGCFDLLDKDLSFCVENKPYIRF